MKYCVAAAFLAAIAAATGFTLHALAVPLKIAGWLMFGLATVTVLYQLPKQIAAFRQARKPASADEWEITLPDRGHDKVTRQLEAEAERSEIAQRNRQYKQMEQGYRRDQRQRRLTRKHRRRLERHQRWYDIRRGLGMAGTGPEALYDRVVTPEPIDWSDPDQREPYERAVYEVWLAEQLRLTDLANMAADQEQRERQERNQRWLERAHRMGLKGIGPVGQPLPGARTFVPAPDGKTARDGAGRVIEFIEGERGTFVTILPPDMLAEAERGGFIWEVTRKPAIVATPVKKAPARPEWHS